jgi:membrane protease YdiL (CAAX protease family)
MTTAVSDSPFRFKLVPMLVVLVLGLGLPYLAAYAVHYSNLLLHYAKPDGSLLEYLYIQHAFQLAFALLFIWLLKRFQPFDAGLHWPEGKTYIGAAIAWGAFFGVLMLVVDYLPELLAHKPMDMGYPVTRGNIGWLIFEGVYVGPTEEIPFRSLLVGYLIAAMPGKFRVGRFSMSWAGIIVAALFALAHAANFFTRTTWAAAGQQVYAFALGVLYAYWLEKSRSVVAPIIGHNVGDVVETGLCFVLISLWS